ncbi:N-acetylmuramoyl-L-alanine amidase [Oceanobacillus neutriphilus]|uniref:N-acetylmuramoyl-L-alanine amidase YrvJ n=1 Tax=Oceanobacillus neutriphilus TaxID=531815 RepID=A0ABQ2P2X9_9BACI|nr:N-acetylmuramoyl-L-alanine amidase [Oceanobacillus neutriphilus]GGP16686.1 putative N-acetylmuramoyl-L-alanine amidase YrvJ [Oceanobacillus neutriphilus]
MKYNITIGIAFLICLFVLLPTVHADSGKTYKVDSEKIELMNEPAKDAAVIGELEKGYKITIFEDSYGWGKTFYNGEPAWVALYQLTEVDNDINNIEENQEAEQPDIAEQKNESAAASEPNNEPTKVIANGKLYRINASAVNLRSAPDKNAAVITTLSNGSQITIFQESYGWGQTYYNDQEVWIALYLLDEVNGSTDNEVSEESETTDSPQITEESETEEAEPDQKDEETAAAESQEEKQEVQAEQSSEAPLAGYHFVIDPGHGGKDPGAIGSEIYEKTLTLISAKRLEQKLHNKGASVTFTRTDDTYISLGQRAVISNSTDADAFISLHYNSSEDQSARGIETFYNEAGSLANSVQTSLMNHVDLIDRGAKQAGFQVLKENKHPAILIELGFISNPDEQKLVQTDSYQENAADGIAEGLEAYFN